MSELELPLITKALTLEKYQALHTEVFYEVEQYENLEKFRTIISEVENFISSNKEMITVVPYPICSFNLTSDGNSLIYGSSNGNIAIFNIQDQVLVSDLAIGSKPLDNLILTQDKKLIITPQSISVKIFNAEDLTLVKDLKSSKSVVTRIALTPCGEWLYCGTKDGYIRKCSMKDYNTQAVANLKSKIDEIGISDDGKIMYVASSDLVVRLYDLLSSTEIHAFPPQEDLHPVIKMSGDSTLLAFCYKDFSIKLWDVKKLAVSMTLKGHTGNIKSMMFCQNSQFLVTGSEDTTIRVWPLFLKSGPIILSGHTAPINSIQVSANSEYIYSASEDSTFRQWAFPTFSHYSELTKHEKMIRRLKVTPDEKYLISVSNEGIIKIWDLVENKFYKQLANIKRDITRIEIPSNGSRLIISTTAGDVIVYNLHSLAKEKSVQAARGGIRVLKLNPAGDKLVIGSTESRIGVWSFPDLKFEYYLRGHNKCVWGGAFSIDGRYLYTGSEDKCIKIWNMNTQECLGTLVKHEFSIFFLAVSKSNEVLISGDTGGFIIVWNIRGRYAENVLKKHSLWIINIYLSHDDSYFISGDESGLMCFWDLRTRQCLTSYKSTSNVWYFESDSSEKYIYYSKKNEQVVARYPNPMNSYDIMLFGPDNSCNQFMEYLYKLLIDKSCLAHDEQMDEYVILPYKINVLHLYAYLGLIDHIKSAVTDKFPIVLSSDGETAISIMLYRGANKGIDLILEKYCAEISKNPTVISLIENVIPLLNHIGSAQLSNLYQTFMRVSPDESLPNHCSGAFKYPLYHASDVSKLSSKSFFPLKIQSVEGEPIIFKESYLKIDYSIGSEYSLEFLNSILSCPNPEIFKSAFISSALNYKWENVKYYMLIQALVYLIYMVFLCLYTLKLFNSTYLLISIFTINLLMGIFEVFQMSVSGIRYWRELWNYFDLITDFTCLLYSGFLLFIGDYEFLNKVFEILTLTSWMRGISYFRIFKQTRYMINLLTEVIKDMRSFMVLLIYSLLGFSFLFLVTNSSTSILEYVYGSYKLSLGDVPDATSNYDVYQFIIITAAVVMNPVIMLNLLISIIGDTYNRVQSSSAIADMRELCEMILEIEHLAFWRRNTTLQKYLQVCSSKDIEEETVLTSEESFSVLETKLDQLQKSVEASAATHIQIIEDIKNFKVSTDDKLTALDSLIKQLLPTKDTA